MKGRRKIRTTKWNLQAQLRIEAQLLLAGRSQKAKNRFLDATAAFDNDHEPIGVLAGCSLSAHNKQR
jgi:hypothetical protein